MLHPLRLGTIGGPETFAGQSTDALRKMFPHLGEPVYYASGEAMYAALAGGEVDAIVGAAANLSGETELSHMVSDFGSRLYVAAEAQLPFGAHLLARRGSQRADIRIVHGGPASIAQAQAFLDAELPGARTARYSDPLATGAAVAAGDGFDAVIGTAGLAERFGLDILAHGIDGGHVNGNWWAVSTREAFDDAPETLIIVGRWNGSGKVGAAVSALARAGYQLETVSMRPTGSVLFEGDYLLRFAGAGNLNEVKSAVSAIPGARLAGALRAR